MAICACTKVSSSLNGASPCLLFPPLMFYLKTYCFGLAWINARCPPKPLYRSPSSAGQGRGNMMKGSRVETRTGRKHSPINITDKTDWTCEEREVKFITNQIRV